MTKQTPAHDAQQQRLVDDARRSLDEIERSLAKELANTPRNEDRVEELRRTREDILAKLREVGAPEDGRPERKTSVDQVVAIFKKYLYMKDELPLLAVLGAVAANKLPGDPVWLLLVGPPGVGKTELLQSLGRVPKVYTAATLTEASLLSGTPERDRAKDARGGLLREIGEFGVLVAKDFGSVLSMHRDTRAQLLAAFRELFDGRWTRYVGTDGGRRLHWEGKLGFIGACTPSIDSHHTVTASMGERFQLCRLPETNGKDAEKLTESALAQAGHESSLRYELSQAVVGLLHSIGKPEPLTNDERQRLIGLATLVVRCRSAVERDGRSREVVLVPGAEAPTRLAKALERLLAGLSAIGTDRVTAWKVVMKVGLDSMPVLRRKVIEELAKHHHDGVQNVRTSTEVAEAIDYPTSTATRALEDLTAYGVVKRFAGNPNRWGLDPWAHARYVAATSPEKSGGQGSPPEKSSDQGASDPHPKSHMDGNKGSDISGEDSHPSPTDVSGEHPEQPDLSPHASAG